jgi:hypothetical protein
MPTEGSTSRTSVVQKAGRGQGYTSNNQEVTGPMLTGNAAPKMLRETVLAAKADAAAKRYASTV